MSKGKEIMVSLFTLSTGKKIYLREPVIGDQEEVARIAGKDGSDNQLLAGMLMGKEMFRQLLVQVDDTKVNGPIDLEKNFNFKEWNECQKATKMMIGDIDSKNLPMEVVSFGGN